MTAANILLLALVVVLALCLLLIFMINAEWRGADQPKYRTADGAAIARQTRRIIDTAVAHASAPVSAQAGHICCCDLDAARRAGSAAALHDMGQKPGVLPTINPHPSDALAHVAWRIAYQRTSAAAQRGAA